MWHCHNDNIKSVWFQSKCLRLLLDLSTLTAPAQPVNSQSRLHNGLHGCSCESAMHVDSMRCVHQVGCTSAQHQRQPKKCPLQILQTEHSTMYMCMCMQTLATCQRI